MVQGPADHERASSCIHDWIDSAWQCAWQCDPYKNVQVNDMCGKGPYAVIPMGMLGSDWRITKDYNSGADSASSGYRRQSFTTNVLRTTLGPGSSLTRGNWHRFDARER